MPVETHQTNYKDDDKHPISPFLNDQTSTSEKAKLKREKEKRAIEVAQAELREKLLKQNVETLQETCGDQKGEIKELKGKLNEDEKKLQKLQSELSECRKKILEMQEKLDKHEKETQEMQAKLHEHEKENQKLRNAQDKFEQKSKELQAERDNYENESRQYKDEKDEAEKSVKKIERTRREDLETLSFEHKSEVFKLKTEIASIENRRIKGRKSTLSNGQWLMVGESLFSPDGSVELRMQTDGKIAVYWGGSCRFQNTRDQRPDIKGITLEGGNLVMYDTTFLMSQAVWQINRASVDADSEGVFLSVQDDGNVVLCDVVLYKGTELWSTNTKKP
ncbi:hypothetical protein TWF694_005212 [Orbilia ellipsospora]